MKFFKIWFYFCAYIKLIIFKITYGKRFSVGTHVTWRSNFKVMIDDKGKVIIGNNCFFNNDCSINSIQSIKIGDGTIFGEGVKIYDHNHRFSDLEKSIKSQGFVSAGVSIGSHCWLGSNVVVLKGSTISDNCVIGAGVIVNGFIPANTIIKQNEYITEEIRTGN